MPIYNENSIIEYYINEANSRSTSPGTFENIFGNLTQKVLLDIENKEFIIKGINFKKFYLRLKEIYKYRGIYNLFEKRYSAFDMYLWKREKKNKKDMKIVDVRVPLFFALEIYKVFQDISDFYNLPYYNNVSINIWNKTWISNFEKRNVPPTDTTNLKNIRYSLLEYQKEFIENYDILKYRYDLEGHILAFEQGLGKTLTAIALSECLNKNQIIIVCPNSLKDNWANEIKSYFDKYNINEFFWKADVYVSGNSKMSMTKNPKYIIVNQESIDSIFNMVSPNKDTMIIVDECHNFRSNTSIRSANLLKLKEITNSKDNLMMSGTPIKYTPDEIIPVLRMIDPYFTEELADVYKKSFNQYSEEITSVVKERFGRVMYRRTKEQVLKLPPKNIEKLYFSIKDPSKYYVKYLKSKTLAIFYEEYKKKLKQFEYLRREFEYIVNSYSSADRKLTSDYLKYIFQTADPNQTNPDVHEHRELVYKSFLQDYVYPNIKDEKTYKRLEYLEKQYIFMKNSAMGIAIGRVFPEARTNCFIEIFDQNLNHIKKYIDSNPKKTVIFTQFLQVAKHISEVLTEEGIGNVLIVGETKNRIETITKFRTEDSIDVLVATTQTLSTGVTLTEANQMFFFGTPYRDADFKQACDRIHRIGQTSEVNIYNVLLKSIEKNITDRLDEIIELSQRSTESIMND